MAAETHGKLGLYLSVPFCRAKCSFCNFASGVGSEAAMELYVDQLCLEIGQARQKAEGLHASLPEVVDTVYFGGGTPSLLAPSQLRRIFSAIRDSFQLEGEAEITLEAAPNQIPEEILDAALELGVNRISLGVQSFIDRESAAVGRLHTGQSCLAEISRLRAAGVRDLGVDLIAGLPYQTLESFEESLAIAASASLTHLSVYMLEIDDESRLGREVLNGGARLHAPAVASEEQAAEMYETACSRLPEYGFLQYEISNFARTDHQSRHNRKYWERAPYLGCGLDAHSMLVSATGAVRFANPDELADYPAAEPVGVRRVDDTEAFEESLFLGLRLVEGVSIAALQEQFGALTELVEAGLSDLLDEGLMELTPTHWRLTSRGRLVSNEVFGRLLEPVSA